MLPTAIIDPALGKTGAHNLGFAELLSRQAAEPGRFGVWCSKSADDELLGRLGEGGEAIAPIFTADFYQIIGKAGGVADHWDWIRSEEHTSELESLMRISYAVLFLKKKKI